MQRSELNPDPFKAFDKLVDYLARRDHSTKELRQKLQSKFTNEAIESAIAEAHQRKYILPPDELAEKVYESLNRKNKGFLYILNYLQQKGLPAVEKDADLEVQKAQAVMETKLCQQQTLTYKDRPKLERTLKNRGFDLETIKTVIKEIEFTTPEDNR